jgi:serine/threonine-protein kinase
MREAGFWKADWFLGLVLCAVALLVAYAALALLRRQRQTKSDALPAESNRLRGLALMGQGQLDKAFEAFRTCPLDDGLMQNLYKLALDFERQRQFAEAAVVYRYMAGHNPTFRDIEQRQVRGSATPDAVEPARLLSIGRYEIGKPIGKGAMGLVYLARDTTINRIVAIKTMALSQEFEESELAEVKERFFREAETAGRLNHPNIVTIYDAGEENGLAYIVMEFLKGGDLIPFTKPGQVLPWPQVVSILARVADALAYAHGNKVVHRDVKPANVMYEPVSDQVKVTDFGVARLTDVSKTKTGMVLGTPSFMSPEQLTGKKVDGRSDLFSLGVTLYQMLGGRPPFVGESLVQLMRKITGESPADIRSVNPLVPDALAAVVERALIKDVALRYQSGEEMARDLRACLPATQHPEVDILL